MTAPHPYLSPIITLYRQNANTEEAVKMAKYMRDQFPYLGIKAPIRKELNKQFSAEYGQPNPEDLEQIIWGLWQLPEREFQYFAQFLLDRMKKHVTPKHLPLLERLITTKSWWDTVDGLASNTVGGMLTRFPDIRDDTIGKWRNSDDFWLRRITLLFQLKYRDQTDRALLFSLIEQNLDSKEFFIQKAIGWALREYSKREPDVVQKYVASTPLAPLSEREALKWMKNKGII